MFKAYKTNSRFLKYSLAGGLAIIGALFNTGCKKLIEVGAPVYTITGENAYGTDVTATAVVTDILARMDYYSFSNSDGRLTNLYLTTGLESDELVLYNLNSRFLSMFYLNALNSVTDPGVWTNTYPIVYAANAAIEGISSSNGLSESVRKQLLGESKFIRAFCYFYLLNLYGDVPLVTSTNALLNATLSRTPVDKVYSQIVQDLKGADSLLSTDYRSGNVSVSTTERVRPNKWAAKAMLSRAYLYMKEYSLAETLATQVIDQKSLFHLDSLKNVFLKNSNESIWQLQNVHNTSANTGGGFIFILPAQGPNTSSFPVYLSNYVVNSFEANDLRKKYWVDSVKTGTSVFYYPYKYKSGAATPAGNTTEYEMVLRLGEQYLIRSEARLQLGNLDGALEDLNIVRTRAGLEAVQTASAGSLDDSIFHERQVELFTEWGHRWFDLKRTGRVDNVMTVVAASKGGSWHPNWAFWPITVIELNSNPNLVQNEGY